MGQKTYPAIGADVSALMPAVGDDVSDRMTMASPGDQPMDLRAVLGRLGAGVAEMLNPVDLVRGVYGAVTQPLATGNAVVQGMMGQAGQAREAFNKGDYLEALGRLTAAGLPVIGPVAADIGETIAGGGDVPTNLGRGLGLALPFAGPAAIRGAGRAGRLVPAVQRAALATPLEASAASRIADVMSPKIGANKSRFGGMAEDVAPALAANPEMSAWSREGLQANVEGLYQQAIKGLDAAADERLSARTINTQPLIEELRLKRKRLTAEAVEGSKLVRGVNAADEPLQYRGGQPPPRRLGRGQIAKAPTLYARPIGDDVVPAPNAPRVAMIDQAIDELSRLGPVARYEPLRVMRQAYDQPAKIKYAPSVTADFLKKTGEASGAADVTDVLRTHLASMDPGTAAANADYTLARSARDVLAATHEVEKTRPKVGRQIIARLTGATVGGQTAGLPGAAAGYLLAPVVDAAVNSGLTTKLKTARVLMEMAQAIRRGDIDHLKALQMRLPRRIGLQGLTLMGQQEE